MQSTLDHLEAFARQGFRTLCCAVKHIAPAEYEVIILGRKNIIM